MGFNANNQPMGGGGKTYEAMEAGTYPARLVGVAIVGMHEQTFQGETKPAKDNIALTYEFLDEFMKDDDGNDIPDKPRWLTESMPFNNINNARAKSTDRYLSIDPTNVHGGDWAELLGTPIMVQVTSKAGTGVHTGKTFNNVGGVAPMRPKEAQKAPELVNDSFLFDFYSPTKVSWDQAPWRVKSLVRSALNFEGTEMEAWANEDDKAFAANNPAGGGQAIKIEDVPSDVKEMNRGPKGRKAFAKEFGTDEENW